MPEDDLPGLLAAALSRIRGAQVLLARSRACNLDDCLMLFGQAQAYLERLRDHLSSSGPASRSLGRQAVALAAETRHAGVLLEQAALRGRRSIARLRLAVPEYTATGAHGPLRLRGHISYLG